MVQRAAAYWPATTKLRKNSPKISWASDARDDAIESQNRRRLGRSARSWSEEIGPSPHRVHVIIDCVS